MLKLFHHRIQTLKKVKTRLKKIIIYFTYLLLSFSDEIFKLCKDLYSQDKIFARAILNYNINKWRSCQIKVGLLSSSTVGISSGI